MKPQFRTSVLSGKRVLVALLTVLLGACGGGGSSKSSGTTRPHTTVRQVASIVARHASGIRVALTAEDECRSIECLFVENRFNRWDAIAQKASDLDLDLSVAEPVAAEIRSLERDTRRTIRDLMSAKAALHSCFAAHQGGTIDECSTEDRAYEAAWKALGPALDAWDPYL